MPSYYQPLLHQLPLTPPEYMPYAADPYASQYYGLAQEQHYDAKVHDKYSYGKQEIYQGSIGRGSFEHNHAQVSSYPARQENPYGNIGAPVLPPIRIPDATSTQSRQSLDAPQAQEQPKEEKVAGGVAAHLDYEMDQMVDFVAEMAQGMYDLYSTRFCIADIDMSRSVQPSSAVTPAFRKYVSQILTSTRLPSSTIVLALHYLSTRMTMLSNQGVFHSSAGHLYHMLTTALMLASKFLDDNTFQNRSWAEVSHISVAELNKHELDWLKDIMWDLHIDPTDSTGFNGWFAKWKAYQAKKAAMSVQALKITPIDTSLRLQHSAPKYMPPTPMYTPTHSDNMYGVRDRSPTYWNNWTPARTLSPPSANHSSPTTPNWYDQSAAYAQVGSVWNQAPRLPMPSSHNSPYYSTYGQQFPSIWSAHSNSCGCGHCMPNYDRYTMGNSYGVQAVVS